MNDCAIRDEVRAAAWLDRCHFGDVSATMSAMIAEGVKVQTIVTSPPYWGLRSYLPEGHPDKHLEIGQEPTLRDFIDKLVGVFELCRELLADDGTAWINMGDAYAGSWGAQSRGNTTGEAKSRLEGSTMLSARQIGAAQLGRTGTGSLKNTPGLKPKDLMGQPWRLAFALQDAGWYLRRDIIWNKLNPMPESVTDRPTTAHEYLFLLTKSERYYYDAEAIREPVTASTMARLSQDIEDQAGSLRANGGEKSNGAMKAVARGVGWGHGTDAEVRNRGRVTKRDSFKRENSKRAMVHPGQTMGTHRPDRADTVPDGFRNKRSVWSIATQSYTGAHFATFPEKLVEPCVLAGSRGGDTVFDPFFGSGTTGAVAQRLGRRFIGCELNRDNDSLQRTRLQQPGLMLETP